MMKELFDSEILLNKNVTNIYSYVYTVLWELQKKVWK